MDERDPWLKECIRTGKLVRAIRLVREGNYSCEEIADVVIAVLLDPTSPELRVNRILRTFLHSDPKFGNPHIFWNHSLTLFTGELWKRRLIGWIKKFNRAAFRGEYGHQNLSFTGPLLKDFEKFARWDDDPKDFGLTRWNLLWCVNSRFAAYVHARIKKGKFESEQVFLQWEFKTLRMCGDWSDKQSRMETLVRLEATFKRLNELGGDVRGFEEVLAQWRR